MSKKSNSSDSDSDEKIPESFQNLTIETNGKVSPRCDEPRAPTSKGHKAQNRLFYRALEPKSKLPRAVSEDASQEFSEPSKRCKAEMPPEPRLKPLVSDGSQIPFLDLNSLDSSDCSEINAGAASCASVPQIGWDLPFIGASASDP